MSRAQSPARLQLGELPEEVATPPLQGGLGRSSVQTLGSGGTGGRRASAGRSGGRAQSTGPNLTYLQTDETLDEDQYLEDPSAQGAPVDGSGNDPVRSSDRRDAPRRSPSQGGTPGASHTICNKFLKIEKYVNFCKFCNHF